MFENVTLKIVLKKKQQHSIRTSAQTHVSDERLSSLKKKLERGGNNSSRVLLWSLRE